MAKGLKNIIHNCKEATKLSLKREEQRLSVKERMQLRIHLLFCDACKNFVKQSALINTAFKSFKERIKQVPPEELPAAAKERMQARLNELK
jgi:predicted anti-sigma-YlaC factor YlaD